MFDVTGDLDALGGELCGVAHRSGNDVDALGQTLDYALGDVTGEGEVNAVDALRILQYAANVGNPKYEFSAPWAAGDVDLNGEISGVDAVRILQYAANDGNPKYALGK